MHLLIMALFAVVSRVLPAVAARVFTALGVGLFTAGALTGLLSAATQVVLTYSNQIAGATYTLVSMSGCFAGINLIIAAFGVRVAWKATSIAVAKL